LVGLKPGDHFGIGGEPGRVVVDHQMLAGKVK
jgi:hypothetical protein